MFKAAGMFLMIVIGYMLSAVLKTKHLVNFLKNKTGLEDLCI